MKKAEKTRAYIIEKSAPLFNIKGYAGTSLNDLMNATGLTKGALYGNFENKNEIAIAVYHHSVGVLNKRISDLLATKETPVEKLLVFTQFYRDNWKKIFKKGGCAIQNASVEADDSALFMKEHVQASIRSWAAYISDIIEEGKKQNGIKKNISASQYAYTIILILEGGIMLSKIMETEAFLFSALDRIVDIIHYEIKK